MRQAPGLYPGPSRYSPVFHLLLVVFLFTATAGFAGCKGGGPTPAEKRQAAFRTANSHLARGEDYLAATALRTALRHDPDFLPAYLLLGDIALRQRQWWEASTAYGRVLDSRPHDPVALVRMARVHMLSGWPLKARALVDQALRQDPMNYDAQVLLAEMDIQHGQTEAAAARLEHLWTETPARHEAPLLLADQWSSMGRKDEAIALLKRVAETASGKSLVLQQLGLLMEETGQLAEARNVIGELTTDYPSRAAFSRLADICRRQGDIPGAAQAWRKLIEREPDNIQHRLDLAALYLYERHDPPSAEVILGQAINDIPKPYAAISELAGIYAGTGRTQEALQLLDVSIEPKVVAGQVGMRRMRAAIYATLGREADARNELDLILKYHPVELDSLNLRGSLALRHHSLNIALADYRTIINQQWENVAGRVQLARTHFASGDDLLARQILEETIRIAPEDIETSRLLVAYHLLRGNVDKALHEQRSLASLHPKVSIFRQRIAELHLRSGDYAAAVDDLRQQLHDAPQNPALLARIGSTLHALGYLDQAREAYAAALHQAPNHAPSIAGFSRLLIRAGQPERAMALATAASAAFPYNPDLRLVRGEIALMLGYRNLAQTLFMQVMQQQPGWAAPYVQLTEAVTQSSNADGRHLALMAAQADDTSAQYLKGLLEQKDGEPEKAKNLFRAILTRRPDFLPAAMSLAQMLATTGPSTAQGAADALPLASTAADAPDSQGLGILGYVQYLLHNPEAALDAYLQALEADPDNPEIHFRMAQVFFSASNASMARHYLAEAQHVGLPSRLQRPAEQLQNVLPAYSVPAKPIR